MMTNGKFRRHLAGLVMTAGVLVASACGASGDEAVDTASAVASLESVIDDSGIRDAEDDGDEFFEIELDDCPVADDKRILGDLATETGNEAVGEDVTSGEQSRTVWRTAYRPVVICDRASEDSGVGIDAALAPDIDFLIETIAGPGDDFEVEEVDTESFRGGTLKAVCVSYANEESSDYCEARWGDGELSIGLYVWGHSDDPELARATQTVLRENLEQIIEGL